MTDILTNGLASREAIMKPLPTRLLYCREQKYLQY